MNRFILKILGGNILVSVANCTAVTCSRTELEEERRDWNEGKNWSNCSPLPVVSRTYIFACRFVPLEGRTVFGETVSPALAALLNPREDHSSGDHGLNTQP